MGPLGKFLPAPRGHPLGCACTPASVSSASFVRLTQLAQFTALERPRVEPWSRRRQQCEDERSKTCCRSAQSIRVSSNAGLPCSPLILLPLLFQIESVQCCDVKLRAMLPVAQQEVKRCGDAGGSGAAAAAWATQGRRLCLCFALQPRSACSLCLCRHVSHDESQRLGPAPVERAQPSPCL